MFVTTGQDKYTYRDAVDNIRHSEKVRCMDLTFHNVPAYPVIVAAKSATGRENPSLLSATSDAIFHRVFFYVAASVQPFSAALTRYVSMVALAGQSSGWPVSDNAGFSLLSASPPLFERENSGGDSIHLLSEFIAMMTNIPQTRPYFTWLFLAVRRSDVHSKPHRCEVTAPDYLSARQIISRDHIASFAGRMPVRKA